jgi:hypothetical protein
MNRSTENEQIPSSWVIFLWVAIDPRTIWASKELVFFNQEGCQAGLSDHLVDARMLMSSESAYVTHSADARKSFADLVGE